MWCGVMVLSGVASIGNNVCNRGNQWRDWPGNGVISGMTGNGIIND